MNAATPSAPEEAFAIEARVVRRAFSRAGAGYDAVAVLQACTRKATRGEVCLGGSDATTNTVTAKKLNYSGSISLDDVSNALNRY